MNFIICKYRKIILVMSASIILSYMFFGCAQNVRYYFYDGNPLQFEEVSIIVLQPDLMLIEFDNIAMAKFPKTFDMPTGKHKLDLFYARSSTTLDTTTTYSGRSFIELTARPGYIYYIYPKILLQNKWKPEVIELKDMEDISKFNPSYFSGLSDGKNIKNKVLQHFNSQQTHGLHIYEDAIDGHVWK